MSGMRKVIAQRMFASHNEIPNVTQNIKIDVTELLALREKINAGKEKADKISVNDMIIKAVGKVVSEQERFRMTIEGNDFVLYDQINVGMAVGLDDGLVVPVIKDVDKKGLRQISKEAKELAKKAKAGKLMPEDMGNGRITISNIGMFGTHSFTPIINQPEASIVGVCGTEDELALVNGQVVVRKKMMVCVTYDHRILNGTEVCVFESRLKQLLENPVEILL
jgi:pyruvate dehydrogenase E2 component (dihydrolipoamide acetyltransferase)